MMTDFRALCAELTAWAEKTSAHYFQPPDVLLRARAALADGPAAPAPPADGEVADWSRQEIAFPGEQYHEDMGAVTWWRLPVNEPPWVGTPNDSDWPGYHTHFTPAPPVPVNALPLPEVGE